MRGDKALTIRDFSAGLIEIDGGIDLPSGAAQAMSNVLPIGRRGIKRRPKTTAIASYAQAASNIWWDQDAGITDGLLVGTSNLYRLATGVSLGALGGTGVPTFVTAPVSGGQGPIYFQNAGNAKQVTTGFVLAAWTASAGTLPLSQSGVIAYHGNRMWVANVSGNTSRLYFSEAGDPRIWSGGTSGYADIDPDHGGNITAICPCGPYLLVFKTNQLYVVYDLNTGANRKIGQGIGVTAMDYVCQGRYGEVYFNAVGGGFRGNTYRTDGASIQAIADGLTSHSGTLAYDGREGLLFVNASPDVYVYSEQLGSWWRFSFGNAGANGRISVSRGTLYLPPTTGTTPYSWFPSFGSETTVSPGADGDGSAITSYWWCSDLDLGVPELRKRVTHVDIEGASLASAGVAKDAASVAPSLTSLSFGPSGSTVQSARLNNLGVARYWAPYLYDSASNAWNVRAITMNFSTRRN